MSFVFVFFAAHTIHTLYIVLQSLMEMCEYNHDFQSDASKYTYCETQYIGKPWQRKWHLTFTVPLSTQEYKFVPVFI